MSGGGFTLGGVSGHPVAYGATAPIVNGSEISGQEYYVTDNGLVTGVIQEQWVFDGAVWVQVPSGAISFAPEYASHADATASLGAEKVFRWTQANVDGVPSPSGSQLGLTQ